MVDRRFPLGPTSGRFRSQAVRSDTATWTAAAVFGSRRAPRQDSAARSLCAWPNRGRWSALSAATTPRSAA